MSSADRSRIRFYITPALQHLAISLRTFLCENPDIDHLAVGALIFHHDVTAKSSPHLLLLQRASFDSAFPSVWEIPGGTCEYSDETILHALVREVYEETKLRVTKVVAQVGGLDTVKLKGKQWAKICFSVDVEEVAGRERMEDIAVRIAKTEHSTFKWGLLGDVEDAAVMTEGQREVMRRGFEISNR